MVAMSIASRAGLAENALADRVALVTGAASGIGWATTRLLAGLGAVVVALDRDAATLSARCEAVPHADNRGLHRVVFDLADWTVLIPWSRGSRPNTVR
jgi:NAD(P)-dependent dehydrogenase (short-subunit alcohol dehydrogenase family)